MTNPLKDISDKMTEATDVFVEGTDLVVTKGDPVEGNEVSLHLTGKKGNEVVLGFSSESYEEFVNEVVVGSEREWEIVGESAGGER